MPLKKIRITIDMLMMIILPLLMAYSLIGETIHEVIGICIFTLFIAHHVINRKWWTGIFKGKYNAGRTMNTTVNLLLAVYMILQPVSGVLMSKYVLKDVTVSGISGTLRTIHMTFAYWGFMLLSFHLGLHVRAVTASLAKKLNKNVKAVLVIIFLIISAYGVYAFVKRGIGDYLLMKVMFAFFDLDESRIRFMIDYVAVMVLVGNIGFYLQSGLNKIQKTGKDGKNNGKETVSGKR